MSRLRAAMVVGTTTAVALVAHGCGTETAGPDPDVSPQFIVEYGDTACHTDSNGCGGLSEGDKQAIKDAMDDHVRTDDPSCAYIKNQTVAALDEGRGNWFTADGDGIGWFGYWKRYYQGGQYRRVLGFNQYYLDRMSQFYYRQQMAATAIHEGAHDLDNDEGTATHWETTCIDW